LIERPNQPKLDTRAESLRSIFNFKPPRRMSSHAMKLGTHRKRAQTMTFVNDLYIPNRSAIIRSSSSRALLPSGPVPPRRSRSPIMQRAQSCRTFSSATSKSRGTNNFVTDFPLLVETRASSRSRRNLLDLALEKACYSPTG
jgi:hypothetical protein